MVSADVVVQADTFPKLLIENAQAPRGKRNVRGARKAPALRQNAPLMFTLPTPSPTLTRGAVLSFR